MKTEQEIRKMMGLDDGMEKFRKWLKEILPFRLEEAKTFSEVIALYEFTLNWSFQKGQTKVIVL